MSIQSISKQVGETFFYFVLRQNLRGCISVLDVGCGYNSALRYTGLPFVSEGIDIHKKNIIIGKKEHIHDRYKLGDIRKLASYYKPKSFDAVVCIDVIEHLAEKEGISLLRNMERVARKRVILLTPNGFYHQHAIDDNPYQVHRSGWSKAQFIKSGYNVYGLRGLKYLRDDHASVKYKPWFFWGLVSFVTEVILYPFPDVCFDILAVKDM